LWQTCAKDWSAPQNQARELLIRKRSKLPPMLIMMLDTPKGIVSGMLNKTAAYAHHDAGYDNAKNIKGRKRNIVTDTQGLLLAVVIMSARSSENQ
jgi:hypothetical protein